MPRVHEKAHTLSEILVVIAIMGIVTAVAVPSFFYQDAAKLARCQGLTGAQRHGREGHANPD